MCTAIRDNNLFGRTLDLEYSYDEKIVVVPRSYEFTFSGQKVRNHHAMIGVAHIANGYPLLYDGINEKGLAAAGLNFPGNAVYYDPAEGKHNIASFELIPWILSLCDTVDYAERLLLNANITSVPFSSELPPTPLHWMIVDKSRAITVEQTCDGLAIYENTIGVMTNNPPFTYHLLRTADYMCLDSYSRPNTLCPDIDLNEYSRGMGGLGLPGDYSSNGRFVRAVFGKYHTTQDDSCVNRFFHVMDTVSIPKGCVKTDDGKDVLTVYTSCADLEEPAYYFTTYNCRRIKCVQLSEELANADELRSFAMNPHECKDQIEYFNE
ncbi:MAG: choloylglycine hydrolase family protein [Ruminococcaceae bacterium]|nr:choloylglycine hydrolase family protein [Oscillospiraceae bacterium]